MAAEVFRHGLHRHHRPDSCGHPRSERSACIRQLCFHHGGKPSPSLVSQSFLVTAFDASIKRSRRLARTSAAVRSPAIYNCRIRRVTISQLPQEYALQHLFCTAASTAVQVDENKRQNCHIDCHSTCKSAPGNLRSQV